MKKLLYVPLIIWTTLIFSGCVPQGNNKSKNPFISQSLSQSPSQDGDFGIQSQYSSFDKIFVIVNSEEELSESSAVSLDSVNEGMGFKVFSTNGCGKPLHQREKCFVRVRYVGKEYSESNSGIKSANLKVGNLTIPLTVNFQKENPSVSLETVINGAVIEENMDSYCLSGSCYLTMQYKNLGSAPHSAASLQVPPGYFISYNSCNKSLAPRQSCFVRLKIQDVEDMVSGDVILNVNGQPIVRTIRVLTEDNVSPIVSSFVVNSQADSSGIFVKDESASISISIETNRPQGVKIKWSENDLCSGGSWEGVSDLNSLRKHSLSLNQINKLSFKVKDAMENESDCVSYSIVHDNINPVINFSQIALLELNEINDSANYNYQYVISDSNKKSDHKVQIFDGQSCPTPTELMDNSLESKNVSLNIRQYKSLLVVVEDKAGNTASKCSFPITYGQVNSLVVSGSETEELEADKDKNFTASLKDVFGNNLKNLDLEVSSSLETKNFNTGASGQASITVSGSPLYSGSGMKYLGVNNQLNNHLSVKYVPNNQVITKTIKLARRSCTELLHFDNQTSDGLYLVDVDGAGGQDPMTVYCDMAGGGWMRMDNRLSYQTGKHCSSGYGTVDQNGSWSLMAKPQNSGTHASRGACGISSGVNITMEEIKVSDAILGSNSTCSSINYPEPKIQVVSALGSVQNYNNQSDSLSGYDFAATSGSPISILSKSLSQGLGNGINSFNEGKYKIHFSSKAEERMDTSTPSHTNGNVSNKLMYTFLDDIVVAESSVTYYMMTGWISHTSNMTLYNPGGVAQWTTGSRVRNNGNFSTEDNYPATLSSVVKNSYFGLTTSASVWNNGNGNHAADKLFLSVKYKTCIQKPVTAKIWVRTGAYVYPKSCAHAKLRNPLLMGSSVPTLVDSDGVNGPQSPMEVICNFN